MNSSLPTLLNFCEDDIDWQLCGELSSNSLVKRACDMWNGGIHNTKDISSQLKISVATVERYLHQCADFEMCDYGLKKYNNINNY